MKEFEVKVIETASRIVTVTASSADMAERIVRSMYHDEDIVLDYSDYDYVEFETIGELKEQ
jgi:hypothetical protein